MLWFWINKQNGVDGRPKVACARLLAGANAAEKTILTSHPT